MTGQKQTLFRDVGLRTQTDISAIPLKEILNGGPQKDGIPALTNPAFVAVDQADFIADAAMGILLQERGEHKFYPYSILVWHEIANDYIGGTAVTVSFCPLCGSAMVFKRQVGKQVHEFGVSGKLWQSNMLMYDRATESLWSQIEGRAVVGELTGQALSLFHAQVLSFGEAKRIASELQVLSTDTGHLRDYHRYPYGDYDQHDQLYFPIKHPDQRLPLKTLMIAATLGGQAFAFHREALIAAGKARLDTPAGPIEARVSAQGEITLSDEKGEQLPSFVSMWFSWANHNQGPVWTGE
ncbi:MAG: DUF3179 domain-containing protein [Bacteroidota bacterium]